MPSVTAVSIVHRILPNPGTFPSTAIDKRAVEGPVLARRLGLVGDTVCDPVNHGGVWQAVYVYADEAADRWVEELQQPIPPGQFGENLRTAGLPVDDAEIGTRWQVGEPGVGPLFEVTAPRIPCATFQMRMAEHPHWVKRFTQRKLPGAYLRVLAEGPVAAGDPVEVVHVPGHGVTVAEVTNIADPATMRRLLEAADDGALELDPNLRGKAEKIAARALS